RRHEYAVAQIRADQRRQLFLFRRHLFQEKSRGAKLILVWRILQQLHRFLRRYFFIALRVAERHTLHRVRRRNHRRVVNENASGSCDPVTTAPSSCASTAAKLGSSGSTSSKPLLSTIVCPIVNASKVEVSSTRQRISGSISRLFVTSRLFTTVHNTLSTGPGGASNPLRCSLSITLSSPSRCHSRSAITGETSFDASAWS